MSKFIKLTNKDIHTKLIRCKEKPVPLLEWIKTNDKKDVAKTKECLQEE